MKNTLKEAGKTIKSNKDEFLKPNVWVKFAKLSIDLKANNLGQGFPDWSPPDFYFDILNNQFKAENNPETLNHQYTRAFGSFKLTNSIINNYSKYYNNTLSYLNQEKLSIPNILVSSGGCGALYNSISSLVNPGDEVVLIEPFYDSYLPVNKYSGAIVKGVSLIPPKFRDIKEYKKMLETDTYEVSSDLNLLNKEEQKSNIKYNKRIKTNLKDKWEFDFEKFSNTLNENTKLVIINSPNNPTGKIFLEEELEEIARILIKKAPNAYIISDEVYEHLYFDEFTSFPRIANLKNNELNKEIWKRVITISSAGKIFSATGVRIGWIIANDQIINKIFTTHQYNTFCIYEPTQSLVADCLDRANDKYRGFNNYYEWLRDYYNKSRTYMFDLLVNKSEIFKKDDYRMKFWLPEGGYFVIGDIKDSNIYNNYDKELEDKRLENEKDFIKHKNDLYSVKLAYDKNLVTIPMSVFYTPENKDYSDRFVRLAFCKKLDTMDKALNNLI